MTDLEETRALLDRLGIEYIFDDGANWFSQGNESDFATIKLVQLCSRETQEWYFYARVGSKQSDQGKKPGDFYTSDIGKPLEKQWWPLEEGETRPEYLD